MKKILLLYKILFVSLPGFAQLTISPGTQWINNGNVNIVIGNMDFVDNGSFSVGNSSVKFTGNQSSMITSAATSDFKILEVAKTNGAKIILGKIINVGTSINFISGLLDLNNNNILLDPAAYIAGESENTRIIGSNGGFVEITQNLNAPLSANPGNLGATITSTADLGNVIIRRGQVPQTGTGLAGSIQRYYSITPQNNSGLNATLRLKYFDAELNGQNENISVIYQSNDNGLNWTTLSQSSRNTNADYVEKNGVSSLSLQTLGNDSSTGPVAGLVFNAKRKKASEVELTWTTTMETNMLGFEIQRKLDNEPDFTATTFVNSKAPGGNSTTTLSYLQIDPNSYTGTSYYRLKIVDLNNNLSYSDIKSVDGKTKGGGGKNNTIQNGDTAMTTSTKAELKSMELPAPKITVGPNPNNGNFWFMVSGMEKETIAAIYTADGKMVKQFRVQNLQQRQVTGMRSGMYILKVEGLNPFWIIVQGEADPVKNFPSINSPSTKINN